MKKKTPSQKKRPEDLSIPTTPGKLAAAVMQGGAKRQEAKPRS